MDFLRRRRRPPAVPAFTGPSRLKRFLLPIPLRSFFAGRAGASVDAGWVIFLPAGDPGAGVGGGDDFGDELIIY